MLTLSVEIRDKSHYCFHLQVLSECKESLKGEKCLNELKIKLISENGKKDAIVLVLNHDHGIINAVPKKIVDIFTKSDTLINLIINKNSEIHGLNIMSDQSKLLKMVEKYLLQPDPDLDINRMFDIKVDQLEDYFEPVDDLRMDNIGGMYLLYYYSRVRWVVEFLIWG